LLKFLNIIENANKPRVIPGTSAEGKAITEKLFGKQKAPVFDMEGNIIPEGSGIMGGKQIQPINMTVKERTGGMLKGKYESDKAVKELMDSGQVSKGARGMKKSKKVQDREMFQAANERLTSDVEGIIKNIKSMEPINAMKEANSVIGRKGKYKNLTPKESKKILQDTEDHIFERDIPEEDFATGGRAGFAVGNVVQPNNDFMNLGLGNMTQGQNTQTAGLLDTLNPFSKSNEEKALEQIEDLRKQEQGIKSLGEGAIELKKDELDNIEKEIQDIKNQYPGDKDIEQAFNPYADIEGQTAGLGVISLAKGALGKIFGPEVAGFLIKRGKDKIKSEIGKKIVKPVIKKAEKKIKKKIMGPRDTGIVFTGGGGPAYTDPDTGVGGGQFTDSLGNTDYQDAYDPGGGEKDGGYIDGTNRRRYAGGGITRANFVGGGMGRRGFLKLLAGAGAGIAGLKSGLVNLMGKGGTKEVAKEVVKQSASTPPPYFFKLAEKIKMLGDDATATTDRTIAKTLKSKDGKSDYMLEEDMVSGDTIIKKINKEGDEMITDVEIMELRKGEVVRGKDGKPRKTPDEYEEVTEANARIEGDTFNDPYYSDGIEIDDILREVDDIPVPKASGGIARMLGE